MSEKKSKPEKFVIGVDTREENPYLFADYKIETKKICLNCGDYTLANMENLVRIERKATPDELLAWFGRNRDRMNISISRLAKIPVKCIVLEFSLENLLNPIYAKRMSINSILGTMAKISLYGIPIFFLERRRYAESFVYRLLSQVLEKSHRNIILFENVDL